MKIVEIHWIDSMGSEGWCEADVSQQSMKMESVGWLVSETVDAYVISASHCLENGDVYAPLKIPKIAVMGFWELKIS